jgi:hypothetical protein
MACFLPSTLDNPLAEAMELTRTAPAQVAAVAIGALIGVVLFAVALVAYSRRRPRRHPFDGTATDVVFIPPYPTRLPVHGGPARVAPPVPPPAPNSEPQIFVRAPGFTPSSALSARAFAKMGYPFAAPGADVAGLEEIEELASSEVCALDSGAVARVLETAPMPVQGGHVAPPLESIPCALDSLPALSSSSIETGPMSAVTMGRIVSIDAGPEERETLNKPSSSVMRSASIAELDLDDAPTQLREPLFDEPPQPWRRLTPPKIRQVTPSPPRVAPPQEEPARRGMLPQRNSWASRPQPAASLLDLSHPGLPLVTPPVPGVRQNWPN